MELIFQHLIQVHIIQHFMVNIKIYKTIIITFLGLGYFYNLKVVIHITFYIGNLCSVVI